MKLLWLVLLLSSSSFGQTTFHINKTHALLVFVQSLAEYPHRPESMRKVFEASAFHTKESRLKLGEFKQLDQAMRRGVDFEEFPVSRHIGFSIKYLLNIQSVYATDLADFETRATGLLNMKDHVVFFSVLRYFTPAFEKLVWNPGYSELLKNQKLFEAKARQWNMDFYYKKAKAFYRASWPEQLKFRLVLYPTPPGTSTYAESMGPVESIGTVGGERALEGRFGVIFHELCHSLYEAQSREEQNKVDDYFKSSKSKFREISYNYFNEVLATAIGNGWFYNKIAKKVDPRSWYNEEKINTMAKAIYPTVEEYFSAGKTLDGDFVNKYISLFEKNFPNAPDETQYLLSFLYLVTDGIKVKVSDVSPIIHKVFQVKSMESSSPFYVEKTVRTMKNGGDLPFFAVIDRTELYQITEAAKREPTLFPQVEMLSGFSGNGVYRFSGSNIPITVAIVDSATINFEDFFRKLRQIKQINVDQWYPLP